MTWRHISDPLSVVLGTIDIGDALEAAFREHGVGTKRNTAPKNTLAKKKPVRKRAIKPRFYYQPETKLERISL